MGAPAARAVNDISRGVEDIGQGNVEQGLNNVIGGVSSGVTGGLTERYRLGPQGDTMKEETAAKNADLAAQDVVDVANATESMRQKKIQTGLAETIRLRRKTPGKAQTLMTPTSTPNATDNKSLLTQTTGNR